MGFSMVQPGTRFGIDTPLFHRGKRDKNLLCNAMEGNAAGMRMVLFDFYYQIDVGEWMTTARKIWGCTVAAFKAPAKDFPFFSITRKGIATWLEPNRIQIEEDTPFSERFAVTGTDESAVRAVFSPAHRHYLISEQLPEKIVIEGAGSWLVLYRRNKNIHPEHWKEFVDQTSAIARSFLQCCPATQSDKALCGD